MSRAAIRLLAAALCAAAACVSQRPTAGGDAAEAGPERVARARAAYARAREAAYAPRRFKALFSGEISPRVGAIGRGYLSLYWDGGALAWRASAPLGGAGRGGTLRRGSDSGDLDFPGAATGADVLAALLGAPDLDLSLEGGAEERSGAVRLTLASPGRTAVVDREGRIVELGLPDGTRVRLEPGAGVPRRIEASGPDGFASLRLESFGPWPEGEPLPP